MLSNKERKQKSSPPKLLTRLPKSPASLPETSQRGAFHLERRVAVGGGSFGG
jgi:hypothetical protein